MSTPVEASGQYEYDGLYEPAEIASYLRVALPPQVIVRTRPTSRGIYTWIRRGIVAPDQQDTPGRDLVADFEDLVSCQAVALFRAEGLRLRDIARAERFFASRYGTLKPFAHHDFWYSRRDILAPFNAEFLVSGVFPGQLAIKDLVLSEAAFLRDRLGFSSQTGQAVEWEPMDGIALVPNVQFGQPCLKGTRIPTSTLWSFVAGGDPVEAVADDYGIEVADVERACEWERQVRAVLEDVTDAARVPA